ncbi:MAG: family 20 glycosylhydrolase [Bacteroidia bacterium]
MRRSIFVSGLLALLALACNPSIPMKTGSLHIVPRPALLTPGEGVFAFAANTPLLVSDSALLPTAQLLADLVNRASGFALRPALATETGTQAVWFHLDPAIEGDEAYTLSVRPDGIALAGRTATGVFYAFQSLRQMLPAAVEQAAATSSSTPFAPAVPAADIADAPRYGYRGMMLDVGRHFFPVETIKRYLDLMALHKLNRFHWHLTEDQGWRIEIKRYPRLTEVGAWRDETLIGHYSDMPHRFDGQRYGGFYTQEEAREIVAYAAARHITVVPEIEMPGHSLAALASYPELGCTEGPFKVASLWGVHEDIYCPNEETFTFLENVLTEIFDIFPGHYIHIGGDEAPKARWEASAYCQDLMRREGLKNEMELQSYFIRRMERFINAHGRDIIGWDEILEGGLAPNATVMSWRGMEGGIEAAHQQHDVIMTPTDFCYFDYYQADPSTEPLAIGGMLPVEKVYRFEPTPAALGSDEARHILGGQANVWTEYIRTPEYLDYMVFPRLCAMTEVLWSPQTARDWDDFVGRLATHLLRLDALGVNYAAHVLGVQATEVVLPGDATLEVSLGSPLAGAEIRYTLDGSAPTTGSLLYAQPLRIDSSLTLTAQSFVDGTARGTAFTRSYKVHKATGRPVALTQAPAARYNPGPYALVDGRYGNGQSTDNWTGFEGDLEAVIDLGTATEVQHLRARFSHSPWSWIFMPREVVFAVSDDGQAFVEVGRSSYPQAADEATPKQILVAEAAFAVRAARYVKVSGKNLGTLPAWHPGAGRQAWLFADEIEVE